MKQQPLIPFQEKQHFVVTQSNDLVEANYSPEFTARAHKTARLILSLISPDDKDLRHYTVRLDALKHYLGMKQTARWGSFYKEISDIAERLSADFIEVKNRDGEYIKAKFLSGFKVSSQKGFITFEISGLLKPYLLELKKNYTSYLLTYIPKLRSSYSIRLYELLHQYRKIGKRYFEVDDLQKKVGSNYQKKYNNFKRKVILQAQKDLKEHTDLAFVFDERKQGRKIVGIEFIIFGNKPKENDNVQLSFLEDVIKQEEQQEAPALSEAIIKAMNALGISEQNIAKYLAKGFDIINGSKEVKDKVIMRCQTLENYYLEKLELTKNSSNKDNLAGFFIKALKEDWTSNKTLKKSKQDAAVKSLREAKKKLERLEAQISNLSKQRKKLQAPIVAALIQDDKQLKAAYERIFSNMSTYRKNYHAEILHLPIREQIEKSAIISSEISLYLMKTYPDHFKEVTALDKQIEALKIELKVLKTKHPNF